MVRGMESYPWFGRFSTGQISPEGQLCCYEGGRTKWTNDNYVPTKWKYWRELTPKEMDIYNKQMGFVDEKSKTTI